jgi:hypothetical protein
MNLDHGRSLEYRRRILPLQKLVQHLIPYPCIVSLRSHTFLLALRGEREKRREHEKGSHGRRDRRDARSDLFALRRRSGRRLDPRRRGNARFVVRARSTASADAEVFVVRVIETTRPVNVRGASTPQRRSGVVPPLVSWLGRELFVSRGALIWPEEMVCGRHQDEQLG